MTVLREIGGNLDLGRGSTVCRSVQQLRLPTRYEDLEPAFRSQLRPNRPLNTLVANAYKAMKMSGGIRFLPLYGLSGSGKTSAAFELATHFPTAWVLRLTRNHIESLETLSRTLSLEFINRPAGKEFLICVVDQYEEVIAEKAAIPTRFVESLSLIDRGELGKCPILVLWLTTDMGFRNSLAEATQRNRRLLLDAHFELLGPPRDEWATIVEETFSYHNGGKSLADFGILRNDIEDIIKRTDTVGMTVQKVGTGLLAYQPELPDLSNYQVIMLWPVTDGQRIVQVTKFTDVRAGYTLEWNAWYNQFNSEDRRTLPMREYNRARLYFNVRLVPIAAADLMPLCNDVEPTKTALDRFAETHFVSILRGKWNQDAFSPLRERASARADVARDWYAGITKSPIIVGKGIAKALTKLGFDARPEVEIPSNYNPVRADVLVTEPGSPQQRIIELKVFAPKNTTTSGVRDAIRMTLKRHARFAGFLSKG